MTPAFWAVFGLLAATWATAGAGIARGYVHRPTAGQRRAWREAGK